MDIAIFPTEAMPLVMRTLRTALRPQGELDARERLFLATYARLCGFAHDGRDPQPVQPTEVTIASAHQRKRLVQLAALAVLLGRPIRPASFDFLQALSRHLATHEPVLAVIDALRRGQPLRTRLLSMRRGMRVILKQAYVAEGVMGVLRFWGAGFLKLAVNKDRYWRYKRLGLLAEGTLGREYWKHMTSVGFAFPGEPAGIPDALAYHDICHVLAEHETTPLGEIQQGSFQGGSRREDGFAFVQFVILQFHHGLRITPATEARVDCFEPDKVLWAIHRGARCNVDVTHKWNFWPLMGLPIAEARARVTLLPKLGAAGRDPAAAAVTASVMQTSVRA